MEYAKILLIEDDPRICELVATLLTKAGYEVSYETCGQEGLRELYRFQPDLVLLDIMMPEMDGLEVLKRLRELTDIPVIMVSALSQTDVTVRALEMGADDFVKKPFEREELLARIRSVLRRSLTYTTVRQPHLYNDGRLAIDLLEHHVWIDGELVRLTVTEFSLLEYLYLHCGKVCTYSGILEHVWGGAAPNRSQYIHIYMWKLRSKIEQDPNNPRYLITEHGMGYRFEKQS